MREQIWETANTKSPSAPRPVLHSQSCSANERHEGHAIGWVCVTWGLLCVCVCWCVYLWQSVCILSIVTSSIRGKLLFTTCPHEMDTLIHKQDSVWAETRLHNRRGYVKVLLTCVCVYPCFTACVGEKKEKGAHTGFYVLEIRKDVTHSLSEGTLSLAL